MLAFLLPFPTAELSSSKAALRLACWDYIQTARTSVNKEAGTRHLFLGRAGEFCRLRLLPYAFLA
jgi:hypothetical protein